jgi:putative two-component system response regulator
MYTLAKTIDAKDKYTNGHSLRVAKYSRMIAQRLQFSEAELEHLYNMAMLHDIGKIGIPDNIINKPSKLTPEEYDVIKTHPVTGYEILSEMPDLEDIGIGARWHHERYDGGGYPDGLKGDEIPLVARIISVADAYDAMTSNRSYRSLMPQDAVKEEIKKGMGTQFDPYIARVMLDIMEEDPNYELSEGQSFDKGAV